VPVRLVLISPDQDSAEANRIGRIAVATITLTDGDFGAGITARANEDDLFLPDRARPGLTEVVPLTAVAEIESIADDHSGRLKEAGRLAMRGALLGPVGLAASVLALRKPKDVSFGVRLSDGRRFVATTDAVTYATVRAAFVRCKSSASLIDTRADQVIAKYVKERKEAARALVLEEAQPVAAVTREPEPEQRRFGAAPERPAFGRRGR
jgi:hypothetical protein